MPDKKRSDRLDWEDVRVLIELARHGTLSAAARATGVTHATVSRRILNLEADLGQPLFMREANRYTLTEAGKRILALAGPMADSANAIVRTANSLGASLTGPVRVTSTEAVGNYLVLPALRDVRQRYPDLDLVFNVGQLTLNLARSDADIAVRLARPPDASGLVAVKIADLNYHLYAARSYVDGRSPAVWDYIGYPDEYADWPEYKSFESLVLGHRVALKINNLGTRITSARLGLGVAMLPSLMGGSWPELVRVSKAAVMQREIHIVVHEDMLSVPRIKACLDAMVESISQTMELEV